MTAERRGDTAAIIVAALLGEYSLLIMPFIVTAMMQIYGVDEAVAGRLVSEQLAAMGVAGIAMSYLVTRVRPRLIVAAAAVLIIGANALCAVGSIPASLAVGRALTGLGEGSLMAAAGALAAGHRNAHRLFSALGLVIAIVAAAALIAAPLLFEGLGARSVFWLLAATPVAVLFALPWMTGEMIPAVDVPRLGALAVPGAPAVLAAFALLWFGASALWVFAESIGAAQGLSLAQVGRFLAIGQLAGIAGPVMAARLGERFGLECSIVGGSMVMAGGGLLMVYGNAGMLYAAGASFMSLAVMFLAPCFRSLMARLDASGGVVAMSVAFYTGGFGAAPLLVAEAHPAGGGFGSIAWLGTAAFVASGALVVTFRSPLRHAARAGHSS